MFRSLSEEEAERIQPWQAPRIGDQAGDEASTRVPLHQLVDAKAIQAVCGADGSMSADSADRSHASAVLLQQSYDEGYAKGLSDAGRQAAAGFSQHVSPLIQALRRQSSLAELALCDETIALARAMASLILHRELRVDGDVMRQLMEQALAASNAGVPGTRIRLNPDDHAMLMDTIEADESLVWIPDASLARGALIVDSGASRLRAGIVEQLERIIVELDEQPATPGQASGDSPNAAPDSDSAGESASDTSGS